MASIRLLSFINTVSLSQNIFNYKTIVLIEIKTGVVNSKVILSIGPDEIASIIINDTVNELKLAECEKAITIIKAREVMIAK